MSVGLLMMLSCICLVCRCFIFNRRDVSWKKAFIPGYNKYKLGMLGNNKKSICVVNGIIHTILHIYFYICFCIELWIIENYSTEATMPYDAMTDSRIYVSVPKSIANVAIYSKYVLVAIAVIALIMWCIMMWKFTITNKKNPWWILLWAAIPVIPYCYFASTRDFVLDGKRYRLERVEIKDE